jgi:hypothetical protein
LSPYYYLMVGAFIWAVGGLAVVVHLGHAGISDRLVKWIFGLVWPLALLLAFVSIGIDVIVAKGDLRRVLRAYEMRRKEIRNRENGDDD